MCKYRLLWLDTLKFIFSTLMFSLTIINENTFFLEKLISFPLVQHLGYHNTVPTSHNKMQWIVYFKPFIKD